MALRNLLSLVKDLGASMEAVADSSEIAAANMRKMEGSIISVSEQAKKVGGETPPKKAGGGGRSGTVTKHEQSGVPPPPPPGAIYGPDGRLLTPNGVLGPWAGGQGDWRPFALPTPAEIAAILSSSGGLGGGFRSGGGGSGGGFRSGGTAGGGGFSSSSSSGGGPTGGGMSTEERVNQRRFGSGPQVGQTLPWGYTGPGGPGNAAGSSTVTPAGPDDIARVRQSVDDSKRAIVTKLDQVTVLLAASLRGGSPGTEIRRGRG